MFGLANVLQKTYVFIKKGKAAIKNDSLTCSGNTFPTLRN